MKLTSNLFKEVFCLYCDILFTNLSKGKLYSKFFIINKETDEKFLKNSILLIEDKYINNIYNEIKIFNNNLDIPVKLDSQCINKIRDILFSERNHLNFYAYKIMRKFLEFLKNKIRIPKKFQKKYRYLPVNDTNILSYDYFPDFIEVKRDVSFNSIFPIFIRYIDNFNKLSNEFNNLHHLHDLKSKKVDIQIKDIKINFILSLIMNTYPVPKKILELIKSKDLKFLIKNDYYRLQDKKLEIILPSNKVSKLLIYLLFKLIKKNNSGKLNASKLTPFKDLKSDDIDEYLKSYFGHLEFDFKMLVETNIIMSYFLFPSAVTNLFDMTIPYYTTKESILDRIFSDKNSTTFSISLRRPRAKKGKEQVKNYPVTVDLKKQYDILKILIFIIKNRFPNSKEKLIVNKLTYICIIDNFIAEYKQDLTETLYVIICWVKHNLFELNLKKNTVLEYLYGLGKVLITYTKNTQLSNLEQEELEESIVEIFYYYYAVTYHFRSFNKLEEIMSYDSADTFKNFIDFTQEQPSYINNIKIKIKSFFNFFLKILNVQYNIDVDGILPSVNAPPKVRNSIITPKDAVRFCNNITSRDSELLKRVLIIFYLAFWCGLRSSEIKNLKKSDIRFGKQIVINIQESKTFSGIRKIYMNYLAPRFVQDEIKKFLDKLDENDYLFDKNIFIEDIARIKSSLRSFFKDKKLTFHSLRHSFATWAFLKFIAISYDDFKFFLKDYFKKDDPLGLDYIDDENFKKYFGISSEKSNASFLWKLSKVLGHLYPEVTITSYIHLIDLFVIFKNKVLLYKSDLYYSKKGLKSFLPNINSDIGIQKNKSFKYVKNKGYSIDDVLTYLKKGTV